MSACDGSIGPVLNGVDESVSEKVAEYGVEPAGGGMAEGLNTDPGEVTLKSKDWLLPDGSVTSSTMILAGKMTSFADLNGTVCLPTGTLPSSGVVTVASVIVAWRFPVGLAPNLHWILASSRRMTCSMFSRSSTVTTTVFVSPAVK